MAAGEITPDEALTVTRVLDSRCRAALALDRRRPDEAADGETGTARAPTTRAAVTGETAPVAAGAVADTPKTCADARGTLHFACKLPKSTTMTSAVALLSGEARAQRTPLVGLRTAAAGSAAA
jgi:hypothetical protein